jgi:isopentenyl diphosphate isomerase/L-lactate dehydrogenase-like FMN-dependent dehydrogenase
VDSALKHQSRQIDRRRLLRFLAESPLIVSAAGLAAWWPVGAAAYPERAVPASAREALDVFQIRAVAMQTLDPAAWHFVANGADDGKTMDANRAAFDDWQIRVRRLVDVSKINTRVTLFGEELKSPIILAPVGNQRALDDDGELATARAAAGRHLMICSTVTSYSIGAIAAAADGPFWFQLYASADNDLTRKLLADAEAAGCRVVVLTVDGPTRGNREAERWFGRSQGRSGFRPGNFEAPDRPIRLGDAAMTWDIVPWLKANTSMHVVLKGLVTREDAALAVRHGADGIIVSNHGGRQEESGRGTLESLPEVLEGVQDRIPVLIDGGFRRGTDIFKGIALGATAVCIGRPYLWGLGAFGEDGVSRVLSILRAELKRIMQFAGTTSLSAINAEYLVRRDRS